MHDIDRSSLEFNPETSFESNQFEYGGQGEWSGGEIFGETYGESIFSEADETELAAQLLEVSNEAELDQFIGSLLSKAARTVGQIARSPVGQAVGGVLKGVAKKALPLAGGAIGGYIGGPLGAKIGSGLASAAGQALGLEAESMEQEEREFEGARQFVRLAGTTVKQAAAAGTGANPAAIAQNAAIAAARQLAPGLLQGGTQGMQGMQGMQGLQGGGMQQGAGTGRGGSARRGRSGRWLRRGSVIILLGV